MALCVCKQDRSERNKPKVAMDGHLSMFSGPAHDVNMCKNCQKWLAFYLPEYEDCFIVIQVKVLGG